MTHQNALTIRGLKVCDKCVSFSINTVMLMIQGQRLAMSNGPNREGFMLLPDDGSRASF
jgi:hypothetical protein